MDDDPARSADADEPRRPGDREDGSSPAGSREDDPTSPTSDRDGDPGSPTSDRDGDPASAAGDDGTANSASGAREVVVPMRLYKTVTVFSTLVAIVFILGGFVLLDRATQRATASAGEVSLPVVALGLSLIVGGSAVYAFSTRFRTEGMGKPKDDTDEGSNNG